MKVKTLITLGLLLVAAALVLAACGGDEAPTLPPPSVGETETVSETPETTVTEPTEVPTEAVPAESEVEVPFLEEWANSPHADLESEAFAHWNEDDPAVVEANCARCHSGLGFMDFVGADGSAAGSVETAPPVGTPVNCVACHNDATRNMTSVVFPSGVEVTDLGPEARCMQCHQGRASKVQVDEALAALPDMDTPSGELGFINIHYYAAAATQFGTVTKGGYEYDTAPDGTPLSYDAKFQHVEGYNTCVGCHSSHSLELKVEECSVCHTNVSSQEDLASIRMAGSLVDYDGDGNMEEGIGDEIAGLQEALYSAIQTYATEVAGSPIGYNVASHPYWFVDPNADGEISEDEAIRDNAYKSFTGRLMKAAYNYQVSLKDPGNYAHGGKYIIELLYDSIADVNSAISSPVDMSAMHRVDNGHFAGSEEPFRHWDSEGHVPADCAKCHSATGLPQFLTEAAANRDGVTGIVVSQPISNGFMCSTCHSDLTTFERYTVNNVKFPSGAVLSFGEAADANLCLECHQGRESTVSVNAAISRANVGDDEVSAALTFRNPHYFATGATLFGDEAKGAYQYEGKDYSGRFMHVESMATCVQCHDAHALQVNTQLCATCHQVDNSEEGLLDIRLTLTEDYDGDGNVEEGLAGEVQTMHEMLYTAIQEYAAAQDAPIQYSATNYPYFIADPNGNGQVDEGEGAYAAWTPKLLRAAYNYQWVAKDPGAFAHNGRYIMQVLFDSLDDMGADVSGMIRPEVVQPEAEATATP